MRPNMARSLDGAGQVAWTRVRIALIANPASGNGLDLEALAATMRRHGADVRPCESPEAGSAAELAGRLGVPLAVIPTGTANDFARACDLPSDLEAAAELAATGAETR